MTSLPCVQWGFPVLSEDTQKTCFGQFWLDTWYKITRLKTKEDKFTKQAKQLHSHWINVWKKAKKCMELLWLEKKIWMMTKKISVNIIWNEWIFEEIERSKMLGEGLWNSGESQLEWTRNFRKINLYKITAKPVCCCHFKLNK